jgi:peptidyl-tRNA hydrolase, PTH1 family
MYLIVGLGNPGEEYTGTRHNLGFMVLQEYRKKKNFEDWHAEKKFKAEISKNDQFILAMPQTYMNNSGLAVEAIASYFKIAPEDVIIIHDDLDLQLGRIKIRSDGAAGGHHGVENIMEKLGTDKFIRVKIGIGNEQAFQGEHKRASFGAEKFVMEHFSESESSEVKHMLKQSIKALDTLLEKGLQTAQNQYN